MMRIASRCASFRAFAAGAALALAVIPAEAAEDADAASSLPAAWAAAAREAPSSDGARDVLDSSSATTRNGMRLADERGPAESRAPADTADVRFGERKSYAIPAAEVLGFAFLLNQV